MCLIRFFCFSFFDRPSLQLQWWFPIRPYVNYQRGVTLRRRIFWREVNFLARSWFFAISSENWYCKEEINALDVWLIFRKIFACYKINSFYVFCDFLLLLQKQLWLYGTIFSITRDAHNCFCSITAIAVMTHYIKILCVGTSLQMQLQKNSRFFNLKK